MLEGPQSLVLSSQTMHELRNKNYWLVPQYGVLCTVKAKKEKAENIKERTLSSFITIPLN